MKQKLEDLNEKFESGEIPETKAIALRQKIKDFLEVLREEGL